jgi:hypothetical protein
MTLKGMIDADRICAEHSFQRKSASAFRRYQLDQNRMAIVLESNRADK